MVYAKKFGVFFRHPAAEFGGWPPDLRRFLFRRRGRGATRRLSVRCHHGVAWAMTVWGLTPTRLNMVEKQKLDYWIFLRIIYCNLPGLGSWVVANQPAIWIRIILLWRTHCVHVSVYSDRCCYSHDFRRYLYHLISVYKTQRATDFDLISSS